MSTREIFTDKKIAIGQPVFERAWCLPLWFQCLEQQGIPKENITLCFAYSPSYDGTLEALKYYGESYGDLRIYEYDLPTFPGREDMSRFTTLSQLRNGLLSMVRETDVDYFISWDNDILFQPDSIHWMFDTLEEKQAGAVGASIDMGGRDDFMQHPSIMHFPEAVGEISYRKPWEEYSHTEPTQADIIMAVKLMSREVVDNCEYRWDKAGEDIGWCYSLQEQGYSRWFEPRTHGIHLYDKQLAIHTMKKFKTLEYPEILSKLKYWYNQGEPSE